MSFACTGRIGQWNGYELGMGRTYVRTGRRTTRQGSTERTSTQIVAWVVLTSRHPASGLPSSSSQQGEGVQNVYISHPPARAFEGVSGGERMLAAIRNFA